jgi:hypothetical protein
MAESIMREWGDLVYAQQDDDSPELAALKHVEKNLAMTVMSEQARSRLFAEAQEIASTPETLEQWLEDNGLPSLEA